MDGGAHRDAARAAGALADESAIDERHTCIAPHGASALSSRIDHHVPTIPVPACAYVQMTGPTGAHSMDPSVLARKQLTELKGIASHLQMRGYQRLKKAELIDAIIAATQGGSPNGAAAAPDSAGAVSNGDGEARGNGAASGARTNGSDASRQTNATSTGATSGDDT